ncbi:FecR family protein [Pedobacter sp. AW31-3R]|uniref:FecR family protein n=1 Tax=Pedobacter sp. AW31-3R TaxID=3445781 RepID=UPI003FA11E89
MENQQLAQEKLLKKYQQGLCTPEEKEIVEYLYIFAARSVKYNEEAIDDLQLRDEIWARLSSAHGIKNITEENTLSFPEQRRFALWKKISVAAALLIALGAGLFYRNTLAHPEQVVYTKDIGPGNTNATLTLADGKVIVLSDARKGDLAEEQGVVIRKTADGQIVYELADQGVAMNNRMNTLSTSRGQNYEVRLPDGTKVLLNAASSLQYPSSFLGSDSRKVELTGEAYFEVSKDKAHPFVVYSKGQTVEVLGTHFNISAYADDALAKTTLLEGSVKINNRLLKPNQQFVRSDAREQIVAVNTDEAIAWTQGYFMFNDEPLENILSRIARWYNVEIVYKDQDIRKKKFFGTITKYDHLSKVLSLLAKTRDVEFEITGNKVLVDQ